MQKSKRIVLVLLCAAITIVVLGNAATAQTTIFGVISGKGGVISGSGFTVKFIPAGTGATFYDNLEVGQGSTTVFCPSGGTLCSTLFVGQWLEIDNQIYQIAQIDTCATACVILTLPYQGQSENRIPVYINMSIWNVYVVTFTTPFVNPPAVTFAVAGWPSNGSSPGAGGFSSTMVFDQSGVNKGLSNKGFQVYSEPTFSGGPTLRGSTWKWTFVAVGN
jgi:hypothetical protein